MNVYPGNKLNEIKKNKNKIEFTLVFSTLYFKSTCHDSL